jgi:hypothetical protein
MQTRTARGPKNWVVVTRDPKAKAFHFHIGYIWALKAHRQQVYPMTHVRTWDDAMSLADTMTND